MPVFSPSPPAAALGAFTALTFFRAGATSRNCTVKINWQQTGGAPSAIKPSSTSAAVADNTTGWTLVAVTDTAPADAVEASVTVSAAGCAASEVRYVDCAGLFPGTTNIWTRGGLVGSTLAYVERSDDGGSSWQTIRATEDPVSLGVAQALTVVDTEAPVNPATPSQYRAWVEVPVDSVTTLLSPISAPVSATLSAEAWWIHDPTEPALAYELTAQQPSGTDAATSIPSQAVNSARSETVFRPFGRSTAVVQRGDAYKPTIPLGFVVTGDTDEATVAALFANGRTVLLRSDTADCWYVDLGAADPVQRLQTADRLTSPLFVHAMVCTVVEAP